MSNSNTPLIPRNALFGNPDRVAPFISPNGQLLSYLAPHHGVLNVWIGPLNDPAAAQCVTDDTRRGIHFYRWAYTNRHVLYVQDQDGDESFNAYCLDVSSQSISNLTPLPNIQARVVAVSPRHPEEIVVALNDRNPQLHDLYRVNLISGERSLLLENPRYAGFVIDDCYRVRLAVELTSDGGKLIWNLTDDGKWERLMEISAEDLLTTSPVGFNHAGEILYLLDSRGRNTAALKSLDMATGELTTLFEHATADVCGVLTHPTEGNVQAVAWNEQRLHWAAVDPSMATDLQRLLEFSRGTIEVVSRSLDNRQWLVADLLDDGPLRYYRYDQHVGETTFLFSNRSALEDVPLAKMYPVRIRSRDELDLVGYYTLPPWKDQEGRPAEPLPMVLLVHGGPWSRDVWGLNPLHQLLANRGYMVLSVNFRGSSGFGKAFVNAGNREWGGRMQDDLSDAVQWAIEQRIAAADRVAVMGASYGGYACLCALTMTPDMFACGIDMFGPSSLVKFLDTIPASWQSLVDLFASRVGDHRTPSGRAFLESRSPLNQVHRVTKPLLCAQGANDPRVRREESEQIVNAMQDSGVPVTYVLYPDEGHGFTRPENDLSFVAVVEAFLAKHLRGRTEPIGTTCRTSSIEVLVGGEHVPGLLEATS